MRIALSKGRVADNFLDMLVQKNIIEEKPNIGRELIYNISGIDIIIARSSDLSLILDSKYADVAILGSDVINEKYSDKYVELLDLKTGKCYFALASLPNNDLNMMKVIATKYPKTAKRYLELLKSECEIIKLNGCLELYPNIGLSDGIIDIVESGKTLEANGLVIYEKFEEVTTRIITTKENSNNNEVKRLLNRLS